jgi:hypothetical protein
VRVSCWPVTIWKFAARANCWAKRKAARFTKSASPVHGFTGAGSAGAQSRKVPELDRPLDHGPEIDLQSPALIPDDYLPDVHSRLILYKRIASARDEGELRELQVEMIDRFGLLPSRSKTYFG